MAKTIEAIGIAMLFGVFCIAGLVMFMSEFTNPSTYNTNIGGENVTRDMRNIANTMNTSIGNVYTGMHNASSNQTVLVFGVDTSQIVNNAFGQFLMMGYNMMQILFQMPSIVGNVISLSIQAGEGSPIAAALLSLGLTLGAVVSMIIIFQFLKLFMHQEV
jgi:hypothetical protein